MEQFIAEYGLWIMLLIPVLFIACIALIMAILYIGAMVVWYTFKVLFWGFVLLVPFLIIALLAMWQNGGTLP